MHKILCVDLDGTILLTDSLHESILIFIKTNPLRVFFLFSWLLKGRAYLKQKLAEYVELDVTILPYNQKFIQWIIQEKNKGRKIVLVTAAYKNIANAVAKHLGIFDEVLSSDEHINLRAQTKASVLQQRYGINQYDYAGNSSADIPIWKTAHNVILVNASNRLIQRVKKLVSIEKIFPRETFSLKKFCSAIRVHQYAKNLLLFLPLIAAHLFFNTATLALIILGFISFCCMASSVYILNDLLDLTADRKHISKSQRAIACGSLSIFNAILFNIGFFTISILIACFLPLTFQIILITYYLLTLVYSFYLKNIVLIDVVCLSILYTLRIVAGMSLIITNDYSPWMLLFSIFFFLSLAFLKRVSELTAVEKKGKKHLVGRDYAVSDRFVLIIFGICSGFISILVFALYLNSSAAIKLYTNPNALLLVFPCLLYWICRIWLLASNGKVNEDPVLYALHDKQSYYVALIICIILFIGSI